MDNAVELGAGPHTNLRLILAGRQVRHAVVSDPLLPGYLSLERCWVQYAIRNGLVCGDDHPAEECPFASDFFDLVVMINVLDHTTDPERCIREAKRITKPGGCLVIGEDLADDASLRSLPDGFDLMHPSHCSREVLDRTLTVGFDSIFHSILSRNECRAPDVHAGTYLYAGVKHTDDPA